MTNSSPTPPLHNPERLAAEYEARRGSLAKGASQIESLTNMWLDAESVNYLSVTSRAKSTESFVSKACRIKDGVSKYPAPFTDLTDLVGLRVITYLPAAVDQVCHILEEQLDVTENEDKGKRTAERGEYGYASRHLLARLTTQRAALPEYADLRDLTFEIQVRTAGQHAWAEFEHDTRYKAHDLGLHKPDIDRRFVLTAALIEMIDREFSEIDRIYQRVASGAPVAADVRAVEDSSPDAERITAAATSSSIPRSRTKVGPPRTPQERTEPRPSGEPGPSADTTTPPSTETSSEGLLDARSLPAILSKRYAGAVSSRKEHYENLSRLLSTLGIRAASDLESEVANIDSNKVADAMAHQFPAGQVRRLEDDLLAARGPRFITSYGNALGAQGTPRRTLENRWTKLVRAGFTGPG